MSANNDDGRCCAVEERAPWFKCDRCGFEILPVFVQGTGWFRRCPNCGREIENINALSAPKVVDQTQLKAQLLASMIGV